MTEHEQYAQLLSIIHPQRTEDIIETAKRILREARPTEERLAIRNELLNLGNAIARILNSIQYEPETRRELLQYAIQSFFFFTQRLSDYEKLEALEIDERHLALKSRAITEKAETSPAKILSLTEMKNILTENV